MSADTLTARQQIGLHACCIGRHLAAVGGNLRGICRALATLPAALVLAAAFFALTLLAPRTHRYE